MGDKDATQEKQGQETEEVASIRPIRPGDRRGHGRRHLLDTCE
ncbi:MAG: hypothetical protein WBL02_01135 [Methanomethylovorans sp.]|nr:hypothetical protein [Methanomethylovorans sp.]